MNLPDFMLNEIEVRDNLKLSRTSINNVLKKHKLKGYKSDGKKWKFFRVKYIRQVNLKEFKLDGKKDYIFVMIDDYSRFIICLSLFDHCPTTKELTSSLQKLNLKLRDILADKGIQFKE